MILLTVFEIIGTLAGAVTFLFISGITFRLIYVNRFRRRADSDDIAKFYVNEDKFIGKIIRRMGDECYMEYLDQENKVCHRNFHINQLYPAW